MAFRWRSKGKTEKRNGNWDAAVGKTVAHGIWGLGKPFQEGYRCRYSVGFRVGAVLLFLGPKLC